MISVVRQSNVLYYVSHNMDHDPTSLDELHGQPYVTWFWNEAPESIRRAYRARSDFWARAPYCIAQQHMMRRNR